MATISIIDYGMANLRSVQKAFERVGAEARIETDPEVIRKAEKVVLPGVGVFRDAIARLRETHLDEAIGEQIRRGTPFLGICLGLQLLFDTSYEEGRHQGLGILAGEVVRFPHVPGFKVPHMGWNQVRVLRPSPLFRDLPPNASTYFVHSYFVAPADRSLAAGETDYPEPFVSSVWRDNIVATQFHPEKSQAVGMTMLRNFASM